MSLVGIPQSPPERIRGMRWAKNGQIPQAQFARQLVDSSNFARYRRRKCFFTSAGDLDNLPGSNSGSTDRFRFRCETGPLARRFGITYCMALSNHGTGATDSYMDIRATKAGTGTIISKEIHYGALPASTSTPDDMLYEFGFGTVFTDDCEPMTEYEFAIADVDNARTISVCVWEDSLSGDTDNGFLANSYAVTQPIYDEQRRALAASLSESWSYQGAHCFNWSAGPTLFTAPTTPRNIIDGSTAVSAATPGYTLDLRYKRTVSQARVPVRFAAYAQGSSGSDGEVWLVNSAGTAEIKILSIGTTAGWYTTTADLPDTLAKYDVHVYDPTGNLTVSGVSLYEVKQP